MPFPASPVNGAQYSVGTKSYRYNAAATRWEYNGNTATMNWRQVTTSQTLGSLDEDQGLIFNSANPLNVTLGLNANFPYAVGRSTLIENKGTGTLTIVLDSGVVANKVSGQTLVFGGQYSQVSVSKSATNEWEISGNLASS